MTKTITKLILNGQIYEMREYVEYHEELCFTANTSGSTVQLTKNGNPTEVQLETSTNGNDWSDYTIGDTITLANVGDKVYWRNKSETPTGFSTSYGDYYQFVMSGSVAGSGDINYLLCKNSTTTLSSSYCFYNLFYDCTALTTAPELPATTLVDNCYGYMFYGCTSLTTAPELPATTLKTYCYNNMFRGCTSLTATPELPATTLADYCYYGMFRGCTNLTTAPNLPATTLADYCYENMFWGCTSLTTAPELPATTLELYCYNSMFVDCTSLTAIPELPATTLTTNCYLRMFLGCRNIKISTTQTGEYQTEYRIPTSGTGTSGGSDLSSMFDNTGGTFTGTPDINTTYYTSNQVI